MHRKVVYPTQLLMFLMIFDLEESFLCVSDLYFVFHIFLCKKKKCVCIYMKPQISGQSIFMQSSFSLLLTPCFPFLKIFLLNINVAIPFTSFY